jgi:putative polyketide hydroxylase
LTNSAAVATADEKKVAIIEDDAMELGQLYRSAAVLGAGDELPPALRPEQWAGQPGTRAPHLWVSKDAEQFSTLDLLQREWVLFVAWRSTDLPTDPVGAVADALARVSSATPRTAAQDHSQRGLLTDIV